MPLLLLILAATPPSATLLVPDCPALQAPLARALRVELSIESLTLGAPQPDRPVLQLDMECADARARIMVFHPVTSRRASREVPLRDVAPEMRPRALALAFAELLRAEYARLAPAVPEPEAPTAWTIGAQGELRLEPRHTTLHVGARLYGELEDLRLSAGAWSGATQTGLGQIASGIASGRLSLALLRTRAGPISLRLAPYAELGGVWATPTADAAGAAAKPRSALLYGAGLELGASWRLGPLALAFEVSPGYAVGTRLTEDGEEVLELGGFEVLFGLGLHL